MISRALRERDPSPPWQWVFILSFTGVRGAVSLAAALALPLALASGEAFPYRDLILFVSFGVIIITLVGLGLGLPAVVRWLGVAEAGRGEHIAEHQSEIAARREALDAAMKSLDAITEDRELSDEVVKLLRARHEIRVNQLPDSLDPDAHEVTATGMALTRELISAERKFIHVLLRAARSPTRSGGGSSAISIWRKRASPTASIGRYRCEVRIRMSNSQEDTTPHFRGATRPG